MGKKASRLIFLPFVVLLFLFISQSPVFARPQDTSLINLEDSPLSDKQDGKNDEKVIRELLDQELPKYAQNHALEGLTVSGLTIEGNRAYVVAKIGGPSVEMSSQELVLANEAVGGDGIPSNVVGLILEKDNNGVWSILADDNQIASSEINIPVPFTPQVPPGGDWNYTKNCGQTSSAMLFAYYGFLGHSPANDQDITNINSWLAEQYSDDRYLDVNGYWTSTTQLTNLAQNYAGYSNSYHGSNWTLDKLKQEILAGRPVIVAVFTHMLPSGDKHFMVLRGLRFDDSGNITQVIVNDPGRSLASGYGENHAFSVSAFENSWAGNSKAVVVIVAGGSPQPTCSSPSNGVPRDNPSFNSRTINFTWSPPTCEGLDRYELRVSKSNDIVNSAFLTQSITSNNNSFSYNFDSGTVPDGQRLYWALRSHNGAGWSAFSETWSFTIDTRATDTPPSIGIGEWTTKFYGDLNLNSQCGGQQNFPQTYVFKNWGESAPVSGCPDNNWSARMERDVIFPGGNYTFALEADDWARIYVDNQLKVDHWNGATGHYEGYVIPAGTHRVRIEFADTAGNARVSAWWKGSGFDLPKESEDFSQWFADYWPYPDQYWDSVISVKEGYGVLDHQWGNGEPSYGLPADGFSARFRRDFNLNCGIYQFNFNHDDGINFKIDGEQQFDRWNGPIGAYSFTRAITQGVHRFEINYHETGGSANINFTYQQLSGCNPSSPTLQNPSNSTSLAQNSDITLSWFPTSNASQYYVKLNGGPGVDISSGWLDTTSYYIGALWPGVYTWTVTSRNDYGSSSPSASWSFTIESAPSLPDIVVESITPSSYSPVVNEPVTFNVIIKNQGTVDVTSGFYVDLFLDTEPGSCGSDGAYWWRLESLASGATTELTATLGGFDSIGAHNVYVFADSYCEITEEDDSSNISGPVVIDVKESAPSTPSDFRVMGSTQSSITLAWSDTSNESGYGIYEWNGTNFYLTHSLGADTTSFTDTGLNCGNVYYYELSAYNTVGESTHAGWIEGATSDCPVIPDTPSIPSDFRVTGSTQSSITMAWSDTSNETGYHIYEWNGTEPYLTHTLGANTTHYTDTGLVCGTEYAYALSAYNAAGEAGHAGWIEGATSDCPVIPANSKIYLPIIMASSPFQTVPFGLGNPYFEMTFDTSKWKAGPLRLGNIGYYHLFSRNYPDCYIDDLWQHGWDPSRFYLVDSYETHANISFHFQIYYRTGTTNPAFSIIKWGSGEKYAIEIVSIDAINADWSCFNEGKEVLWRSAERGFD